MRNLRLFLSVVVTKSSRRTTDGGVWGSHGGWALSDIVEQVLALRRLMDADPESDSAAQQGDDGEDLASGEAGAVPET
ncbi:hypothetical protein GCM10012280_03610 [Wenjunlia tyrosinilytica]|uniref:Uncharacterized protein n=1 Tax=Wenjunlia tyrosinilytica TaxID=1544741 RepID=A0A917ZFA2_9ACTN|nr:hypothetical protein GCM10012280_03610 [Wenjunlia tyrosinilytica]